MTRANSLVGRMRSPMSVLTESTQSAQDPAGRQAHALVDLPFPTDLVADARELVVTFRSLPQRR